MKIETTALYELCNKHKLFTCGSNRQYRKMFELARNGITQTKLAHILYLCSSGKRLDEIYNLITPLFNEGAK
jgi:thiamine pyrophosphokinase